MGGAAGMVDVAQYFSDPAEDALTYAADSNDAGTVTASVSGSILTLTPVAAGMATVTVTARDPGGLSATQTIDVTVLEIPDPRITEPFLAIDGSRPNAEGVIFGGGGPTQQVRLHIGDEIILVVRVRCDDGAIYTAGRFNAPCFTGNDDVAWRSSDQAVAVVTRGRAEGAAIDSAGIVHGAGAGLVTITTRFKGHVASVPVEVVSDTATGDRSTMDRPDDISGPQIHFVYAVPVGGNDRGYDRTGDMTVVANLMHAWLQAEARMTWRLDTYNGQVDVSFLQIQWTGARDHGSIFDAFANALETQPGLQLRRPGPGRSMRGRRSMCGRPRAPGLNSARGAPLTCLSGPRFAPGLSPCTSSPSAWARTRPTAPRPCSHTGPRTATEPASTTPPGRPRPTRTSVRKSRA